MDAIAPRSVTTASRFPNPTRSSFRARHVRRPLEGAAGARFRREPRNRLAQDRQRRHSRLGAQYRRAPKRQQGLRPQLVRPRRKHGATVGERGFECFCIDSKHAAGDETHNGVTWIGADIRDWFPPPRRHAIVFAAPPCTNPPSAARVGSRTKRKETCARVAFFVE